MESKKITNVLLLMIVLLLAIGVWKITQSRKDARETMNSEYIPGEHLDVEGNTSIKNTYEAKELGFGFDTKSNSATDKSKYTELSAPVFEKTFEYPPNIIMKVLIPADMTQEKNTTSETIRVDPAFLNEGNRDIYFVKKPQNGNQIYAVSSGGDSSHVLYDSHKNVFTTTTETTNPNNKYFPFTKITSKYKTYYQGGKADGNWGSYYAIFDYSDEYFFIVEDKNPEIFKLVNF